MSRRQLTKLVSMVCVAALEELEVCLEYALGLEFQFEELLKERITLVHIISVVISCNLQTNFFNVHRHSLAR